MSPGKGDDIEIAIDVLMSELEGLLRFVSKRFIGPATESSKAGIFGTIIIQCNNVLSTYPFPSQ